MLPAKQIKKPGHFRAGFSLTEIAIVLGVIGFLLSAIWIYVGQATETSRRQRLMQQIVTVANGVHSLYLGQANICGAFELTAKLAAQNAIPANMVRTASCTNAGSPANGAPAGICVDTPWSPAANAANGSFAVESGIPSPPGPAGSAPTAIAVPCGANGLQQFTIELRNLSFANCVNVAPQNSGASAAPGLQDVIINGKDILTNGGTITPSLPVQVKDAQALCSTATGNTIDFVYRLKAASF